MKFSEVVNQASALLHSKGRITYRALKREFDLDDEALEDLKAELIDAARVAVDENGKVLVWIGNNSPESSVQSPESEQVQGPKSKVQGQEAPTLDSKLKDSRRDAAERRQLTVMFIDLVGSTTLSQQLDPEDYHARVVAYQTACHRIIARYDGHVAQYLGDGILVYFGYPAAHEEDAARAVRSGLEIVTAVSLLAYTPPLQVRIGIHTGPVVVGEIGAGEHTEKLALGETPNIAARIQGQAAPNEVVMSAATYRLVEGLFECKDRGQPELKGISTPLTLYHVIKEGEVQSRFEVVARKGLTPLIGREHEFGLLRERWEQAKSGEGQVVLLSGEPGIGKSRLVEALKESVAHEGASCLELRCSPYHQNSALYPVIAHLQRVLGFQSGDSPEEKLRKLAQALGQRSGTQGLAEQAGTSVIASAAKQSLSETEIASSPPAPRNDNARLQLFATLLSLPHPDGYPAITLSPQKQKEKTQEALVAWLCAEAKQQAVVYGWEDLHWADPSTLELLTLFLAQVPTTHLFAVLTFRPEFTPPWGSHSYLNQLTLSRLGRSHVETMVEKVTGDQILPKEVVQQIVSKTDGVPLFVEELTKSVLESVEATGRSPLKALDIPATLQDSLMARLDRLGPAKEIAQLGATIGREFNYDLLQAVSSLNEEALQQGLKQLVKSELVYQNGLPPQARYLFKHALIQDSAYQSLLKSRRQYLHQQIAQVLGEQFPDTTETQPELVAHHYTEAGLIEQAIPYWQRAGQRAIERSAYVEAVNHLTKGLELLQILPDTSERAQQELTLQLALGGSLVTVKGFAASEVEHAYAQALELSRRVGETPQLFPVLHGLRAFYVARAEYKVAHTLGKQLLSLAQNLQDPALLSQAHQGLGTCQYMCGEFIGAREHFDQVISLYNLTQHRDNPTQHRSLTFTKVYSQNLGAWALLSLGYPAQAQKRNNEALTSARELPRPFERAYSLFHTALFHLYLREGLVAQELSEEALTLATEPGFSMISAWATITRGWALAEQGEAEEGIAQMRQGLAAFQATGAEISRPTWLGSIAEACGKVGRVGEGLSLLVEALAIVERTGERFYEAELYRLAGELSLRTGERATGRTGEEEKIAHSPIHPFAHSSPEECFHKAIEIARKQQAKSLELRAATSLARLWQKQGKRTEAHKLLSEVYNWFTEGFDTKDLQEAKALIDELDH